MSVTIVLDNKSLHISPTTNPSFVIKVNIDIDAECEDSRKAVKDNIRNALHKVCIYLRKTVTSFRDEFKVVKHLFDFLKHKIASEKKDIKDHELFWLLKYLADEVNNHVSRTLSSSSGTGVCLSAGSIYQAQKIANSKSKVR